MTPTPHTKAKRGDSARRLFTVALELFTEHGYDNVTTEQIAQAAGVTQRTFFRHFPKKSDVLGAEAERATNVFFTMLDAQPPSKTLIDALVDTIREHASSDQPASQALAFSRLVRNNPGLEAFLGVYQREFEKRLAGWIAGRLDRDPTDLDVEVAAAMLASARRSVMMRWVAQGGDIEEMMNMVSVALKGVDLLTSPATAAAHGSAATTSIVGNSR